METTLLEFFKTHISEQTTLTDWLTIFIYFLTLCASIFAAFTAYKALKENKRLVSAQTEPFIDVKLEVMPQSVNCIRLKITNIGLSSALNISFKFIVLNHDNINVAEKIIKEFSKIGFITKGLSYLSKEDARYTTFINLNESTEERGFSVDDFFRSSFYVEIEFSDNLGKIYKNKFHLIMNELEGHYQIGESDQKKIVDQLKEINKSIKSFKNEHEKFKKEYEKSHRNWTEGELRMKVRWIDLIRARYKRLGKEYPESTITQKSKFSIHELRKQNK